MSIISYGKDCCIITLRPEELQLKIIDSAKKAFPNFVNGGYFGIQATAQTHSTSMLYVDETYVYNRGTHGKPVGTLMIYKNGRAVIMPVEDLRIHNLYTDMRIAISGMTIWPYLQTEEGFVGKFADVARSAPRTMVGIDWEGKIVIVSHKNISARSGGELMANLGCSAAITLDGGGSTCCRVDGRDFIASTRRIHNILYW